MQSAIFTVLLLTPILAQQAGAEAAIIQLDPASPGRTFEGMGAVSAGASTRLLPDYPEPQRSQILDFLFKPKFGAGFQHLKVEIGSGENSTCSCEPSHAVTREELTDPKPRGYEFWLMACLRVMKISSLSGQIAVILPRPPPAAPPPPASKTFPLDP